MENLQPTHHPDPPQPHPPGPETFQAPAPIPTVAVDLPTPSGRLRAARNVIAPLWNVLFGFDLFISYSRRDSKAYAYALAGLLRDRDYRVFVDRDELPAGGVLRGELQTALGRTKALVIVASPGALQSTYVRLEHDTFATLSRGRRPIICVDRTGRMAPDAWLKATERVWLEEPPTAGDAAAPSRDVVDGISTSLRFVRRNRVRRAIVATAAALILASSGFAWWQRGVANVQRGVAETQAGVANQQRGVAERNRHESELRLAASILSEGALLSRARQPNVTPRFAEARAILARERQPLTVADVALWDHRRRCLPLLYRARVAGPGGRVERLSFSADGARLAVVAREPMPPPGDDQRPPALQRPAEHSTLTLWDSRSWRPEKVVLDTPSTISAIALSPDGKSLAVAARESRPAQAPTDPGPRPPPLGGLYDVATLTRTDLPDLGDRVVQFAFSADGARLAASSGRKIVTWDVSHATPGEIPIIATHAFDEPVSSVGLGPRGTWLAHDGGSTPAPLLDLPPRADLPPPADPKPLYSPAPSSVVWSMAVSRSGRVAWNDASKRLWMAGTTGDPTPQPAELAVVGFRLKAMEFVGERLLVGRLEADTPEDRNFMAQVHEAAVRVWRVLDGAEAVVLDDLPEVPTVVAGSPDGRWIACGDADGHVSVWSPHNPGSRTLTGSAGAFQESTDFALPKAPVHYRVTVSPDGRMMLAYGPRASLVDLATGMVICEFAVPANAKSVTSGSFDVSGARVILERAEGQRNNPAVRAETWSLDRGDPQREPQPATLPTPGMAPSGAAQSGGAPSGAASAPRRDPAEGQPARSRPDPGALQTLHLPGGSFAWTSRDDGLTLWKLDRKVPEPVYELRVRPNRWAPSGTHRVVETDDGRVHENILIAGQGLTLQTDGGALVVETLHDVHVWDFARAVRAEAARERARPATDGRPGPDTDLALAEWFALMEMDAAAVSRFKAARAAGASVDRIMLARALWRAGREDPAAAAEAATEFEAAAAAATDDAALRRHLSLCSRAARRLATAPASGGAAPGAADPPKPDITNSHDLPSRLRAEGRWNQ